MRQPEEKPDLPFRGATWIYYSQAGKIAIRQIDEREEESIVSFAPNDIGFVIQRLQEELDSINAGEYNRPEKDAAEDTAQ